MSTYKRHLAIFRKALIPLGIQSLLIAGNVAAQTVNVIEFHNTVLNHYFVTADPAEASAIDAGAAGAGWVRTGQRFSAYPSNLDATKARRNCLIQNVQAKLAQKRDDTEACESAPDVPIGQSAVCRFYASGPNSHFYTAKHDECYSLQLIELAERAKLPTGANFNGWAFEGNAFYADTPDAFGNCATGQTQVYRTYNNRFASNDSNHRFVVGNAERAAMVANGWVAEGVAFCVEDAIPGAMPSPPSQPSEPLVDCGLPFDPTRVARYRKYITKTGGEATDQLEIHATTEAAAGSDFVLSHERLITDSPNYLRAQYALSLNRETLTFHSAVSSETQGEVTTLTQNPPEQTPTKFSLGGNALVQEFELTKTTKVGATSSTTSRLNANSSMWLDSIGPITVEGGSYLNACLIRTTGGDGTGATYDITTWRVPGAGDVKSTMILMDSAKVETARIDLELIGY
jgi:hypothetical protein